MVSRELRRFECGCLVQLVGRGRLESEIRGELKGEGVSQSACKVTAIQTGAYQILNARQLGREGGLLEEDAALLQDGAAMPALRAAGDLPAVEQHIARRAACETHEWFGVSIASSATRSGW